MKREPNILLVVELTRVNESNPTIVKVDSNLNKGNGRMVRGFAIVAQYGQIRRVVTHTFKVKSQSGNGQYVITNGKSWDCSCPEPE